MSTDAPSPKRPRRTRRDGWTAERQLRFLHALAQTRSLTKAAAMVGMSRESAHRLRTRSDGSLLALLWDRALAPVAGKGHNATLTDGALTRALGNLFRRERGDFATIGANDAQTAGA